MYVEEKPIRIEKGDSFKKILSKYGCLALDKQENLSELVGDLEGELNVEDGILTFGDIRFSVQILGFYSDDLKQWSWAWDNEDIGFKQDLIKSAIRINEIGREFNIPEFTTPLFETSYEDCHIWAMVSTSLLNMDAYYSAKVGDLDVFVLIKSDLIKENNTVEKFRDTYNIFQKNFEVFPVLAFEGYTKLKGYTLKEEEEYSLAKIGESRIIVGFTERGNVTHIQMLSPD